MNLKWPINSKIGIHNKYLSELICYHSREATSAASVQEAAAAAALAGANCPNLLRLGASGRHPSNAERDLLRLSARAGGLAVKLHMVECVVLSPDRLAPVLGQRPMLLPHDFCSWIWTHDRAAFHSLMGTARLKEFWSQVRKGRPAVYLNHPARSEIEKTGRGIPHPLPSFRRRGRGGESPVDTRLSLGSYHE